MLNGCDYEREMAFKSRVEKETERKRRRSKMT